MAARPPQWPLRASEKSQDLYPKNLKNRFLGLAKAPIIDDRKLVRIALIRTNLAWPAVVDSRELSRQPKNRFFKFFGYTPLLFLNRPAEPRADWTPSF